MTGARGEVDGDAVPAEPAQQAPEYELVLPPGWIRLDLRRSDKVGVRELADRLLSGQARDLAAGLRPRVELALRSLAAQARAEGALDVYFPWASVGGAPIPARFVVAQTSASEVQDPMEVLLRAAEVDRSSRAVDIRGSVALRTESTSAAGSSFREYLGSTEGSVGDQDVAGAEAIEELVHRRVRYLVGVPGSATKWVSVVFSATVPPGEEGGSLGDALVELFDAIMMSFTWR